MKKKIFALMLSCFMVLSMAACGDGEEGGGNPESGTNVNTPNNGSGASVNTPEPSAPENSQTGRNVSGLLMNIPDGFTMTEWDDSANEVHVVQFAADNGAWIRVSGSMKAVDTIPSDYNDRRFKEIWEWDYYGASSVVCENFGVSEWTGGGEISTATGYGTINDKKFNLGRQLPFTALDQKTGDVWLWHIMYVYPDDMKDTFTEIMNSVTLAQ